MANNRNIAYLLQQHIQGLITQSEQFELNKWLAEDPENVHHFAKLTDPEYLRTAIGAFYKYEKDKKTEWTRLLERIEQKKH